MQGRESQSSRYLDHGDGIAGCKSQVKHSLQDDTSMAHQTLPCGEGQVLGRAKEIPFNIWVHNRGP